MLHVANRIVTASSLPSLFVYNPETWSFVAILAYHRESVTQLCRVNQTQFASGSLDGCIVVWNADALKPARILAFPEKYRSEIDHVFMYHVRSLYALNHRFLIAAIGNGFALFDLYTGERLLDKPDAHQASCLQVVSLYRGRKLLTCSDDGTMKLWGAAQGLYSFFFFFFFFGFVLFFGFEKFLFFFFFLLFLLSSFSSSFSFYF